jgi:hypothetical protein
MTENAVSQAFHRFRQSYQSYCAQNCSYCCHSRDIEDELRYLIL